MNHKSRGRQFVVCVRNDGYPVSLQLHKIYVSLPTEKVAVEDGLLRVIDEDGEDYLYPAEYFVPIEVPAKLKRAIQSSS